MKSSDVIYFLGYTYLSACGDKKVTCTQTCLEEIKYELSDFVMMNFYMYVHE